MIYCILNYLQQDTLLSVLNLIVEVTDVHVILVNVLFELSSYSAVNAHTI